MINTWRKQEVKIKSDNHKVSILNPENKNQNEWFSNTFPLQLSRYPQERYLFPDRSTGAAQRPAVEDRGCTGQLQGMDMCKWIWSKMMLKESICAQQNLKVRKHDVMVKTAKQTTGRSALMRKTKPFFQWRINLCPACHIPPSSPPLSFSI